MYTVIIEDAGGATTKPGYATLREAEDACRHIATWIMEKPELKLINAYIIDSDSALMYDFKSDSYACDGITFENASLKPAA